MEIFIYHCNHVDDEENGSIYTLFGLDRENNFTTINAFNFKPTVYLELPNNKEWKQHSPLTKKVITYCIETLRKRISSKKRQQNYVDNATINKLLPSSWNIVYKKRLYNINKKYENGSYIDKLYPFLEVKCRSHESMQAVNFLSRLNLPSECGNFTITISELIQDPVLKFISQSTLPTCGWIKILKYVKAIDARTYSKLEFNCSIENILTLSPQPDIIPEPKILSFDIETHSTIKNQHPQATNPGDVVICIGVTISDKNRRITKYLFTLGTEVKVENTIVKCYKSDEGKLLLDFAKFIREQNPAVITGYNFLSYDFKYIITRCKYLRIFDLFTKQIGLLRRIQCKEILSTWSSSAYGEQEYHYIDITGICQMDLYPIVKKNYSFSSYTLDNVTKQFGLAGKSGLTYTQIYEKFALGGAKNLSDIGYYCVNDTVITHKLLYKLESWVTYCEMSRTACVPIMYMYLKGNQIQMYSQVLRFGRANNILIGKNPEEIFVDGYEGAIVLTPKPGLYKNILSFDFASLYPSIIMAYNIDFSTFVPENLRNYIPKEHYVIKRWTDDSGRSHNYAFMNAEKFGKGVIPSIIEKHITARKNTRQLIKKISDEYEKTTDPLERKKLNVQLLVLDKRQLAYKICANSMYGALGAPKGYLTFLPGAMTVTRIGRESIQYVANLLCSKFSGNVVYGDTDSCHVFFEGVKTLADAEKKASIVTAQINETLPKPMKLEFEKMYNKYLIFAKKKYIAICCDDNGVEISKIEKGVMSKRRDNCTLARIMYQKCVADVINGLSFHEIEWYLTQTILQMFQNFHSWHLYVISKSLRADYKVKPAHAILSETLQKRGQMIQAGSRIEYVFVKTNMSIKKPKQMQKIESVDYYRLWGDYIHLDFLYYLERFEKVFNEIIFVGFGKQKFMTQLIDFHRQKAAIVNQIKSIASPEFVFY